MDRLYVKESMWQRCDSPARTTTWAQLRERSNVHGAWRIVRQLPDVLDPQVATAQKLRPLAAAASMDIDGPSKVGISVRFSPLLPIVASRATCVP